MRYALLLLALGFSASAETLRVPLEYSSIQAGLDAATDGDTVLISPGTYVEAPVTPTLSALWILGDIDPDTGLAQRPVIDPTALDSSNRLACLRVYGEQVTIGSLVFRNGAEMYPGRRDSSRGGLDTYVSGTLHVERCLFDSVHYAIGRPGLFVLDECEFRNNQYHCVDAGSHKLIARNCIFSGLRGFIITYFGDSSEIDRCVFRDGFDEDWQFAAIGAGMSIHDCIFGPGGPYVSTPFNIRAYGNFWFEHNLVTQNSQPESFGGTVINIMGAANSDTIFVRRNRLINNRNLSPLTVSCDVDTARAARGDFQVIFEDNELDSSSNSVGAHLTFAATVRAVGNRFRLPTSEQHACVVIQPAFLPGVNAWFRDNQFIGTLHALSSLGLTDARWNYWGDSTGPYHPLLNPQGRGGQVSDSVWFDPWYADTNFRANAQPLHALPHEFQLTSYPNPFNATTTLRLAVPEPTIVRVELFDLLGRRVRELWNGPVAYTKDLSVNGDELSSGIYFARAWQTIYHRNLATTKLVLLK